MPTIRLPRAATAAALLALIVGACSGSASASPSGSTPTSSPASVAPSSAAVTSPSPAESTEPSIVLPSLPSQAKDLEALLPDTLCGGSVTKVSLSGPEAIGSSPEFAAVLTQLGKTPADVAFAAVGPQDATNCQVSAGVFRINGADANAFQQSFLELAVSSGGTAPQQKTVAGKTVWVGPDESGESSDYAYFVGDAVFFVTAPDDAAATEVLTGLP